MRAGATLRRSDRLFIGLLVAIPATVAASRLGAPAALQFFLSVVAVVPLAGLIGSATEELTARLGGRAGGLLNATFGNAPDLLIGVFGVQRGLIPLVKATLVGALMSNSALIIGLCAVAAGVVHRRPRFDRREAGHHGILMLLTVAAILFPTVAASVLCASGSCAPAARAPLQSVSVGIAVILLLAYGAYVVFGIFGIEGRRRTVPDEAGRSSRGGRETAAMSERAHAERGRNWPTWLSLLVLALTTVALVPVVDVLTGTVEEVTAVLGWSDLFVGIVIVANAGNVAEGYAAIRLAIQRPGAPSAAEESGLDLSISIASASSIQIATFVLPLVVLYSLFVHPMTLVFGGVEVAILALLVLVFIAIAQDGESNWLEGTQLLVLYAMSAVIFFALPSGTFS